MFGMMNTVQHPEQSDLVPALNGGCRILASLAAAGPGGMTLSELSRELDISKSSIHGLLRTLQAWGHVQRESESRRFRLGGALVSLGQAAASQLRPAALLGERLPVLAGEHQLTFGLAQVADGVAQVVDRAYPNADVHVGIGLGVAYGPFDGAIGKCLLAALDPETAAELIHGSEIPRHTGRTIVDPDDLVAEVDRVRARGWAASAGELKENQAVAAPLQGVDGDLQLVVFALGFPAQLPDDAIPTVGTVLRETVGAVREDLGFGTEKERE
jgi:DNA-binding IclR family transcriptional regulator